MTHPVTMEYRTVGLSGLDISAGAAFRFRWSLPGEEGTGDQDDTLVRSIASIGVISPAILSDEGDSYEVVTGFRRIAAAREAGLEMIPALVIAPGDEGRTTALPIWSDSALHGLPLSEMEKLIFASKAIALAGDRIAESLPFISRLFGRKITREILGKLVGLSPLGEGIKLAIHQGRLSPGDLLQLSAHPGLDTGDAARLLAGSGLSRSGRREAVRGLLGMADLGKDIFTRFVEEYDAEEMPLDEAVSSITHPTMTGDIAFLKQAVSEIELPAAASVHLPQNLEGSSFTIEIKVRDGDDLRVSLERLRKASEDGLIGEMLKVIQGDCRR